MLCCVNRQTSGQTDRQSHKWKLLKNTTLATLTLQNPYIFSHSHFPLLITYLVQVVLQLEQPTSPGVIFGPVLNALRKALCIKDYKN